MRVEHRLISVFQILFAISFLFIFISGFGYNLLLKSAWSVVISVFTLVVFVIFFVFFFFRADQFLARFDEKGQKRITGSLFITAMLFELFIIIESHGIIPPLIDGGHTYAEARYLLAHHHASKSVYFEVYPNNIPVTILRYFLYRFFALFQINNYMLLDRLFSGFVLVLSMFVSWKIACKQFNRRIGNVLLLFLLTCFPFFLYTSYFYTDTTIMVLPVLMLYLWQRHSETSKIRYMILLGLCLGVGYLIRPNIILFLPALAIYMFFVVKLKRTLINLALVGVMLASCIVAGQSYEHHLGYVSNPKYTMPNVHWVMLGLSPVGQYTTSDFYKTYDRHTQVAKKKEDLAVIKDRIARDKTQGLVKLWAIKTVRTWTVGAHAYYWYTEFTNNPTLFYNYVYGNKKALVLFICQVFYLVSLFFMLLSVLAYFRNRKATLNLLIQICLFGNFLFYTFIWEAEPRYSLLFSMFILLSALFGLSELRIEWVHLQQFLQKRQLGRVKRIRTAGVLTLLALVLLCGAINQATWTENRTVSPNYRVNIPHGEGHATATVDSQQSISQTFRVAASFNRIRLKVHKIKDKGQYQLSLILLKTGETVVKQSFWLKSGDSFSGHLEAISIPAQQVTDAQSYKLVIRKIGGSSHAFVQYAVNGKGFEQRDIYSNGALSGNNHPAGKEDLIFQIYDQQMGTYLPGWLYWSLFACLVAFLLNEVYRGSQMDGMVSKRKRLGNYA